MAQPELQRVVYRFCAWHKLTRSWIALQHAIFINLGLAALYVLLDKLFFIGGFYSLLPPLIGATCIATALGAYLTAPRDAAYVGYLIDKNAGFKNLVASGLNVAGQTDEVATVVAARAGHVLHSVAPRKLIPFRRHWTGHHVYIPALVLAAVLLAPRLDLLGRRQRHEKAAAERQEVEKGALKLNVKFNEIAREKDSLKQIENQQITKDIATLAESLKGATKQEALLKLGEFENKYKDELARQRDFALAAKGLRSEPDLKGVAPESREPLKSLAKDLKEGNLSDAAKSLRELARQMEGKKLSAAEKKALARELADLSRNLGDAKQASELSKLLREITASPENLEQLMQQCKNAAADLDSLAALCEECQTLKAMKEGLNDAKREILGDSFKDFNPREVEQYLEGQPTLGGVCSSCAGAGCTKCKGNGWGAGTGGEGHGRGGKPPERPTDTAFKNVMSPSKINKGVVLQQVFVTGLPEKGEAPSEYVEVVRSAKQQAASSLARDAIPREYEEMVKTYFDSLDKKKDENESDH